jgi:hypothetical protein
MHVVVMTVAGELLEPVPSPRPDASESAFMKHHQNRVPGAVSHVLKPIRAGFPALAELSPAARGE